ncbi:hypothetical protein ACJ2A9_21300 [Anaerobacillus sp. MEB173]|uniref:hypothetical protein n=1 Tax=Anaerobacillus sp. MEB173 TaxID=3383345 RepID=UPI003F90DE9D
MTPLELQNALKKRIEHLVSGMRLNSAVGEQKEIQVFEQHLPAKTKSVSRNPETDLYPCIIVYLDEGERGGIDASHSTKVFFVVGVYDDKLDNQGYRDTLTIAQKIIQDLERNPRIDNKFELQYPINWKYSDEENGPYHFAWVESNFEIPSSLREDVEGMI